MFTQGDVIIRHCISTFSEAFVFFLNKQLMVSEQEKESIICVRMGYKNPALGITVWHHSASLVLPNCNPID